MKLEKQDKIAIGITVVILVALYFLINKNSPGNLNLNFAPVDLPQSSTNLPFWLTNNVPTVNNGFTLPLPTLSQNNGVCSTCSLFPT